MTLTEKLILRKKMVAEIDLKPDYIAVKKERDMWAKIIIGDDSAIIERILAYRNHPTLLIYTKELDKIKTKYLIEIRKYIDSL